MAYQLDNAAKSHEDPALIVRKNHAGSVWSVWAVLEGAHAEEIFEGSSEQEASRWIETGGQTWLQERKQKRGS